MPWYLAALAAAVVWGLHYPLVAHALRHLSAVGVLLLTILGIAAMALVNLQAVGNDFVALRGMDARGRALVMLLPLTSLLGSWLLYVSIGQKNATLASLIEISYPVFVALFAYVLFRETALDALTLVGAALVFVGVGIIIWHHP